MSGSVPKAPIAGQIIGTSISITDRSATITSGGTAQQIAAANPTRRGFYLQNLSDTQTLWLSFGSAATAGRPSFKIPPNSLYVTPAHGCPTGLVSVIGSTTGMEFSAGEW